MSLRAIADKRTSKIIGATIAMQVAFFFTPAMADQGSGEASYLIERLLDSDAQTQRDVVYDLEEMGRAAVPSLISAASTAIFISLEICAIDTSVRRCSKISAKSVPSRARIRVT